MSTQPLRKKRKNHYFMRNRTGNRQERFMFFLFCFVLFCFVLFLFFFWEVLAKQNNTYYLFS